MSWSMPVVRSPKSTLNSFCSLTIKHFKQPGYRAGRWELKQEVRCWIWTSHPLTLESENNLPVLKAACVEYCCSCCVYSSTISTIISGKEVLKAIVWFQKTIWPEWEGYVAPNKNTEWRGENGAYMNAYAQRSTTIFECYGEHTQIIPPLKFEVVACNL